MVGYLYIYLTLQPKSNMLAQKKKAKPYAQQQFYHFHLHSIATTLGLTRVSAQTLKLAGELTVYSEVVTDQDAVKAVERFVGEHHKQ